MLPPSIYKPHKFYGNPRANPFITNVDYLFTNESTSLPELPKETFSTKSNASSSITFRNRILEPTQSKILHTAPGEDPEVIHEYPYKETIILRDMHVKLKRLFGEPKPFERIELYPRPEISSSKEVTAADYVEYLSKIDGPAEFKQKLRDKDKEIQRQEKFNHALSLGLKYDHQLALSLKKLVRPDLVESPADRKFRRGANSYIPSSTMILKPRLLEDKKTPPIRRISKKDLTLMLEENKYSDQVIDIDYSEKTKIQTLAKEVCQNFKIFMETTINNKDLYRDVKVELEKERVLDLFFTRQPRNMANLERDIISSIIISKPAEIESISKASRLNKIKIGIQPNKVTAFERINHLFLDANAKFHISIFKGIEKEITDIHDDMAFKQKAIKDKLQFYDRKRLQILNNSQDFATPTLPGHLELLSPAEEIKKFESVHGEMKAFPNEKKVLAGEIQETILRIRQRLGS